MSELRTQRRTVKRGKIIPFEFRKDLAAYLRKQARKDGKSMVAFVEGLIEQHRRFKTPTEESR